MTPPAHGDRPSWLVEGAVLVAVAQDIVSGQRFRLWARDPETTRRRLRRRRPSFFVEEIATGAPVGALYSMEEAVAWHDRTVISCGWQTVEEGTDPPVESAPRPAADDAAVRRSVGEIRLLPLMREKRSRQGGS